MAWRSSRMSALGSKADIATSQGDVRFTPKADIDRQFPPGPKRSPRCDDAHEAAVQVADNLAIQHEPYFNQIGAHPQNVKSHGREMCRHQPARL
jgi:hypothetical protein